MKHMKKTIALFLAVLMTLSVFSVIGFAEGDTVTVTFYDRTQSAASQSQVIPGEKFTQKIPVGSNAVDPFAGLTKEEIRAKLKFPEEDEAMRGSHQTWSFYAWDQSLENITKDTNIFPMFKPTGKLFEISYHDYDGAVLHKSDGSISKELCYYGVHLSDIPTMSRAEDDRYFYKFEGWSLKKGIDPTVNPDDSKYILDLSNGLYLPNDTTLGQVKGQPDYIDLYGEPDDEYVTVNVYAYYTHYNREYTLSLTVNDSYSKPVNGASVQVRSASGQLLDQTFALVDENGKPTGKYKAATGKTDADGKITMLLPYQTKYTIEASHPDLGAIIKEVSVSDLAKGITVSLNPITNSDSADGDNSGSANQYNEQYKPRCTCVCHSFSGGLWITGLNLMHYLFKVKYVCCYDMYATHSDKLAYAA